MCSKLLWRVPPLALALLLVLGCGIRIGEKAPSPDQIVYSGRGFNCLGQIPDHLRSYVYDRLSETEIADFVTCIQNSFASFAARTHGRDQATYAPDEIRRFLESYFLSNKISDELLHQFMVIKQVLVGGDADKISRDELAFAIEVLEDIKKEAIRMKPHVRYLNPELLLQQDASGLGTKLEEAKQALTLSVKILSDRIQKVQKPYYFSDMQSFTEEFRKFVNWDKAFPDAKAASKWVNLLKVSKNLTVSPLNPGGIEPDEWEPWVEAMSSWYVTYLQYEIGVKDRELQSGVGLQNLIFLFQQAVASAKQAVDRQPSKVITYDQTQDLVQAFFDLGLLPTKYRVSSIQQASKVVITRILGDLGTRPEDRAANGLSLLAISFLESEFYRWAYVQLNLDSNFTPNATRAIYDRLTPSLGSSNAPVVLQQKVLPATANSLDWTEFMKTTQYLSRPLFVDKIPRAFVVPDSKLQAYGLEQGFYNLSAMNLLRSLTSLIYRGYSHSMNSSLWLSRVTGPELQQFFTDVREIGIDAGVIDRRDVNTGSRSFVEGKLFTFVSTGWNAADTTGGSEMSLAEAMEYLAFLYSGGITAGRIYQDLLQQCPAGPNDVNGLQTIDRACSETQFTAILYHNFTNLPFYQNYLKGLSTDDQARYGKMGVDLGRSRHSDPLWVERKEINTATVALNYMENVMTRYDSNEDQILTNDELMQALPIFGGFIRKIAKDTMNKDLSEDEVRGVFLYILDNKEIPTNDAWHMAIILKNEFFAPGLNLDRYQLTQVFQAIIGKLLEIGDLNPAVPPPPPSANVQDQGGPMLMPQLLFCHGHLDQTCPQPGIIQLVKPIWNDNSIDPGRSSLFD